MPRNASFSPPAITGGGVVSARPNDGQVYPLPDAGASARTDCQQFFQAMFDSPLMGIAQLSRHGRLLRANRRLCDLLGYDPADLVGCTWQDLTLPEDRNTSGACARRLLSGEADGDERDTRLLRKDGASVWVHLALSLVRTHAGEPASFVVLVLDITERKRLEQERLQLLEEERAARAEAEVAWARAAASEAQAAERAERLHTILETMADGVAVYDTAGHPIQPVNRAYRELFALERGPVRYEALTTFERARLVQVRDAITGALLPFDKTPAGRALQGGVVTGPSADIRARAFDGRELEVNSSAAPLPGPDGRIAGVVLVLRDQTERNRLAREREAARADELAAREVSRRLEAFLVVAAHDLRSPLTAAMGYLGLAQRRFHRLELTAGEVSADLARQVDAVGGHLDDAGQGMERLARLITRLFDLSAIRAGKLELHRAPGDLAALVRESVAEQRLAAPDRAIHLHGPANGRSIPVEVDADRIGEVLTNYLANALKYAPPGQPVEVSVAARRQGHASWARVAVQDRGPGLPPGERTRVWEQFHRASGVTVQGGAREGGLGLGLSISKAIVEAHGGRVGVASHLGQGSTFWFSLPLALVATA
jgi:PAS domain S-box-containing protein